MTLTLVEAKRQAKALRTALQAQGTAIRHAQALEAIAAQHGAKDWNTLHARLARQQGLPALDLNARVHGRYLGQPFTGRVVTLSAVGDLFRIEIRLDAPVDTVRFASFSNLRSLVRATVDAYGRSPQKTSDGVPHLVLDAGARRR
ncbi:glyoxalase superfamily protein [Pseudoxanthomonas winnipegensis]|uniref:glyoxalase superfamily protein n=1 Tax=Pseudoxanthomonas winnipegensis TaxID=2480810 RepID=UPI003F86575F